MERKTFKFGIIGGGLMGREFASAAARWCHLVEAAAKPEIVAVCDKSPAALQWYTENVPSVKLLTGEYRELLASTDVDAVYVAVPHHLHQELYCDVIDAGKHLMGEKPFGIDLPACEAIVEWTRRNPHQLVRCSSESPFFPAVQRIGGLIDTGAFGKIIEANTGFLHSSDLDPEKPMNWKRMVEFNGEYGVMGDLGMHACHLGFRAGWTPRNVRAILSDIVKERPDGTGGRAPCRTWDNATLFCEAVDPRDGESFPWTIKTQRIAPGQKNNWYVEVIGTRTSVRWSSVSADELHLMEYAGGEQAWKTIQTGHETAFKTITGGIFQFGFTDSILQMWTSFLHEMAVGAPPAPFAGCVTPDEALRSHRLFTAALRSHKECAVIGAE